MPTTTRTRRATGVDASVRIELDRLATAIQAEIARRRAEWQLEPAAGAVVDVERLSSITADLPGLGVLAARALRALVKQDPARMLRDAAAFIDTQNRLAASRAAGDAGIDEFGFDREWTETVAMPVFGWLYQHWWRVQVRGVTNLPAAGPVVVVANHAGVIPYDGAMIRTAVLREHPHPRHLRALVLDSLFGTPGMSWLIRRTGNALARDSDAEELLRRGDAVLVFPEGAKGAGKRHRDRYRLGRFGRGGFVELAIRMGAPIVPVSVVGSEEIHPVLTDIPALARLLGQPYAPITPTFPWLGPLGAVPLPSSWIIEFHDPVDTAALAESGAGDPGVVMRVSDAVRGTIQAGIHANLERRGSVFAVS